MLSQSALLFLSALLGGVIMLLLPKLQPATFKLILVFAGSYLFSITIIHLLPDLFALHAINKHVGFYILIGFFLQLLLGFFSKGIEHGHTYHAPQGSYQLVPTTLLASLCIHAFLDGIILSNAISNPFHLSHNHTTNSLLIGIILHKASEAFALVSVLSKIIVQKRGVMLYLLLFSLASPLGLLVSQYCSQQLLLSQAGFVALIAIAGGNFLHISTTIFFESSTNHRINPQTLLAILTGVGLVMLLEYHL
jgi:zinc and cadmium transporter